jgi:hypothetical protein
MTTTYEQALVIARNTDYGDMIDDYEYVRGIGHCFTLDDARCLVIDDAGVPRMAGDDFRPDASLSEWREALARGQLGEPEAGPVITPDMERQAAFRAAVEAFVRCPEEARSPGPGHPAADD